MVPQAPLPSPGGSSRPRDQISVSCTASRFFIIRAPGKPLTHYSSQISHERLAFQAQPSSRQPLTLSGTQRVLRCMVLPMIRPGGWQGPATPQRLAPTVQQRNGPSRGPWSARNSQQFRALAARRALRKRVAPRGFWGLRAGGRLHGGLGRGPAHCISGGVPGPRARYCPS